jgi:hypothetical protein
MKQETKFLFSENYYAEYLNNIEQKTGLRLTESEAGICRALLDIRVKDSECAGACVGGHFKEETKRFIKLGLLHKDSFKYCGVMVPNGKLADIINNIITGLTKAN